MHLSKHDLIQMDGAWLKKLKPEALLEVSNRLLDDVKELQDRLNRNPDNSSQPPSSQAPWSRSTPEPVLAENAESEEQEEREKIEKAAVEIAQKATSEEDKKEDTKKTLKPSLPSKKPPGKQKGSLGYGRTQKLAFTATCDHRPDRCTACGNPLGADAPSQAYTGWDEIDIAPQVQDLIGMTFSVTRHRLYDVTCSCDHISRAMPWRAPPDQQFKTVEVGEWRLVGPRLAGVIVMLSLRMRLSRKRIQELLGELFGLSLSTGVIDETIREAGQACLPLEDVLLNEIIQAPQLNVDETSWPEAGKTLWLWVLYTTNAVLFFIGTRSREILENALQNGFFGILMSDGYAVYRAWTNRLRCWVHLMRKLRGLAESTDRRVAGIGLEMEGLMNTLMDAIYAARSSPPQEALPIIHAKVILRLREICETHRNDLHAVLRGVVREFLYDWDVILRQVAEPHLPLTNNDAERALRHWVISRYISHGTRSEQGSRAFALLASVIETCRLRKASTWQYLGSAIAAARKGLPLPLLPVVADLA